MGATQQSEYPTLPGMLTVQQLGNTVDLEWSPAHGGVLQNGRSSMQQHLVPRHRNASLLQHVNQHPVMAARPHANQEYHETAMPQSAYNPASGRQNAPDLGAAPDEEPQQAATFPSDANLQTLQQHLESVGLHWPKEIKTVIDADNHLASLDPDQKLDLPDDDAGTVKKDISSHAQHLYASLMKEPAEPKAQWPEWRKKQYLKGQTPAFNEVKAKFATPEGRIEAAARCFKAVQSGITVHTTGVPASHFDRKQKVPGIRAKVNLTCSKRVLRIIELASQSKLIAKDILKGDTKHLVDLARNPDAYLSSKVGNTSSNGHKDYRLVKGKGLHPEDDEPVAAAPAASGKKRKRASNAQEGAPNPHSSPKVQPSYNTVAEAVYNLPQIPAEDARRPPSAARDAIVSPAKRRKPTRKVRSATIPPRDSVDLAESSAPPPMAIGVAELSDQSQSNQPEAFASVRINPLPHSSESNLPSSAWVEDFIPPSDIASDPAYFGQSMNTNDLLPLPGVDYSVSSRQPGPGPQQQDFASMHYRNRTAATYNSTPEMQALLQQNPNLEQIFAEMDEA